MRDERLADIGKTVAARLRRTKGVVPVPGAGFELFLHQHFLDARDCARLIGIIDTNRRPSAILAAEPHPDPEFRTSESCDVDRWDPFIEGIDRRICTLMGLKPRQGETMQGQRYAVGQQFKAHYDYFQTDQPYWEEEKKRGGQRSWTTMIYLDQPAGGGETWFSLAGFHVNPRPGLLLAWNNMDADGRPNGQAMHQSLPVTAGIKTIVTKWFRERYWV